MKNINVKNLGVRLILTTIVGLLIVLSYFVYTGYSNYVTLAQKGELMRLSTIAQTISLHIDGDEHKALVSEYKEKDGITSNDKDERYKKIRDVLVYAQKEYGIKTDIYTLFKEANEKGDTTFYFGVTSGGSPYFRHGYDSYPQTLYDEYKNGAIIPVFKDDHGSWLSAFYPIKDKEGNVVCVVEVDQNQEHDTFVMAAKAEALDEIALSVLFFVIITSVILIIIRKIIKIESVNKKKLKQAYAKMEKQNFSIADSINYAKKIQHSIIPTEAGIKEPFKDAFMYYEAKDVVSGDFPWMLRKGNEVYIAAVDCTGHGVPGAMMSFIGYFLLNEINSHHNILSPAEVLDRLNTAVKKTLKQEEEGAKSRDGMDVALCRINTDTYQVQYAGAHRPLYYYNNTELIQYKGDRKAIGGKAKLEKQFTNYQFTVKENESLFFFSDGLPDQFGGPENLKYSPKRVRTIIQENCNRPMATMKEVFSKDFDTWKGNNSQIDDVLMIGLKF